jgi:hypothetical protein
MPTDDRLSQALVILFAVGMSVSAVSCYSAYRYLTLTSMGWSCCRARYGCCYSLPRCKWV